MARSRYLGVLLVLAAAVSWSAANIVIKKAHPDRVLAFLLWSSLFSPLPLLVLDVAFHGFGGLRALPAQLDGRTISSILFQVYPVTMFGYSVWNSLLKRYPVSAVAPLSLLVPVFGLAGSVLIFHEAVPAAKITALALIVGGVVVGLYGPRVLAVTAVLAAGTQSRSWRPSLNRRAGCDDRLPDATHDSAGRMYYRVLTPASQSVRRLSLRRLSSVGTQDRLRSALASKESSMQRLPVLASFAAIAVTGAFGVVPARPPRRTSSGMPMSTTTRRGQHGRRVRPPRGRVPDTPGRVALRDRWGRLR